jgi:hypothetical protein
MPRDRFCSGACPRFRRIHAGGRGMLHVDHRRAKDSCLRRRGVLHSSRSISLRRGVGGNADHSCFWRASSETGHGTNVFDGGSTQLNPSIDEVATVLICSIRRIQYTAVAPASGRRRSPTPIPCQLSCAGYLFESTKSTLETPFPVTVTDFSHVLGGSKTGRCMLCSVRTS